MESLNFLFTLCFIVTNLCFSMSNYLNAHKIKCILTVSSLMKCFFPLKNYVLCCVYTFYWLSDEGITH